MKINYHKWIELRFSHTYFTNGSNVPVELTPFKSTVKTANNYSLMINRVNDRFLFYAGTESTSGNFSIFQDFNAIPDLYFKLMVKDNLFFNYTSLEAPGEEETYYFTVGDNPSKNNSFLHQQQIASDANKVSVKSKKFNIVLPRQENEIEIKDNLGKVIFKETVDGVIIRNYPIDLSAWKDGYFELWLNNEIKSAFFCTDEPLQSGTIGVIHFSMKDIINLYPEVDLYAISFNARQVFYQYEIVVPSTRKINVINMEIAGGSEESYVEPTEQISIGQQTAKVFVTTKPLPFQNNRGNLAKLIVKYSNLFSPRENEIEVVLPNPNPENLKLFNQGKNEGSFFSPTIVYV